MIRIDKNGDRVFRGKIYRDNPAVHRVISRLADDIVECLRDSFDKIELSELPIKPFLYPHWFIVRACGFWIHLSIEPGEEWGDIVELKEIS